jgi:hypothetical protein
MVAAPTPAGSEPERPEKRRGRFTEWTAMAVAVVVLVVGTVVGALVVAHHAHPAAAVVIPPVPLTGPPGPENVVLEQGAPLAGLNIAAAGQSIDGVGCGAESVAYHIHAHLTIFVDGAVRPVPAGVGLVGPVDETGGTQPEFDAAQVCYYFLHTHTQDGVIHIESPTETVYYLGQFFDLWGLPLTNGQVGPATGKVTAYVNGAPYTGDPSRIPLTSHEDIQLDVGTVVGPKTIDWSVTGL